MGAARKGSSNTKLTVVAALGINKIEMFTSAETWCEKLFILFYFFFLLHSVF